jgi:5-methyltetrahydrofolate--homocysteine methyltransferase
MTWHALRQQHERPAGKPHQSLADFVAHNHAQVARRPSRRGLR